MFVVCQGKRGTGIKRTADSYIWREGWLQLAYKDLGLGQRIDTCGVVHRVPDHSRKRGGGCCLKLLGTAEIK